MKHQITLMFEGESAFAKVMALTALPGITGKDYRSLDETQDSLTAPVRRKRKVKRQRDVERYSRTGTQWTPEEDRILKNILDRKPRLTERDTVEVEGLLPGRSFKGIEARARKALKGDVVLRG